MADHGLLLTFGDQIEADLATRIARLTNALDAESLTGIADLVPSYTTLLVMVEPGLADAAAIIAAVERLWSATSSLPANQGAPREVLIPVAYGAQAGPDLIDVARLTGMSPDEVIERHAGATYQVGAIGFSPGFAFLIGLPPELAVPRRSTPRTSVPAGSVGIGGAQTGIYSLSTPGGWSLIGRTTLAMFDPEREPPSLLQTGDLVRFQPVPATPPTLARPRTSILAPRPHPHHRDAFEVLEPGLQTSVQDLGRPGYGRLGVAPGGAADRGALIAGNRLAGNTDGAAGLELTITGPRLSFLRPGKIVVIGADLGAHLNDTRLLVGAVRVVKSGDQLVFRDARARGARAYLCIAGGIEVPMQLGSRSTDMVAGFGGFEGRSLRAGDRLRVGVDRQTDRVIGVPDRLGKRNLVRVVRGPQTEQFDDPAYRTLFSQPFAVSPQSNRLGLRLDGQVILPLGGADIISEGMVTGAIQVTGEGQPIVMLPSRATIGGYPKIGTVIAADLDLLGQLRPGNIIRFEETILPRVEE